MNFFGQRAPDREVVEAAAFACAVGLVRQLSAGGSFDPVHTREHVALGPPRRVSVDQVCAPCLLLQLVPSSSNPASASHLGELGNGLGPQVQRVDIASRRRQIRRRLHRRYGCRRVHRIDQDVSGAVVRAGPHSQIGQISEIAYAPRSFRLDAVELGGQAPYSFAAEPLRQLEFGRNDDQRCARLRRSGLKVEPVIPQRQVGGKLEGGFSDQPIAEIVWGSVVLQLTQTRAHTAVLQPDPQPHRLAVGDVHPERRWATGPADDRRRQATFPVVAVVCGQRGNPVVLGGGRHAQRREHGDQCGFRHDHVLALPVQVLRRDAVAAGKFDQRRGQFSHAANLAGNQSTSRINRSSQVSRRTTSRAFPLSANTTGTRRAPLYWLDMV